MALLALCVVFLIDVLPTYGQGFRLFNGRNHPELDWQVAETAHFRIMYPKHLEGIEIEAGGIAEYSYQALSENLDVEFDEKIRIYLSDEDEILNGYATRFGYTMIWVHVNDVARTWTDSAKWLRRVIAHELAHLFHGKAIQGNRGVLVDALTGDPMPSSGPKASPNTRPNTGTPTGASDGFEQPLWTIVFRTLTASPSGTAACCMPSAIHNSAT